MLSGVYGGVVSTIGSLQGFPGVPANTATPESSREWYRARWLNMRTGQWQLAATVVGQVQEPRNLSRRSVFHVPMNSPTEKSRN